MSEQEKIYPRVTGRSTCYLSRRGRGARDAMPVLHPRAYRRAALKHGATAEEIMEAIWVAAEMRARRRLCAFGAGTGYDRATRQRRRATVEVRRSSERRNKRGVRNEHESRH